MATHPHPPAVTIPHDHRLLDPPLITPGSTTWRSPNGSSSGRSASRASIHQCLECGVAQLTYRRQPESTGTITGRSNDAAPKAARPISQTGLKLTPSDDLATTTPTPLPASSGRRKRYASQKVPSTRTQLAPPAQLPGPLSGADTTTSAPW